MRILILCFSLFCLVSCNESERAKTGAPQTPTQLNSAPDETVQVVHMEGDTNKILMMGRGSEPGWFCQFYQTKVRFVFNNGADSIILKGMDFSNQMRMEKGFENFRFESRNRDTAFITLVRACKEESSGVERPMEMQVKVNKQIFNGCAWIPN
jgi:hypothetical protein